MMKDLAGTYKLFQCIFDYNYRGYILVTDSYYYLIGNAFS